MRLKVHCYGLDAKADPYPCPMGGGKLLSPFLSTTFDWVHILFMSHDDPFPTIRRIFSSYLPPTLFVRHFLPTLHDDFPLVNSQRLNHFGSLT